MLKAFLCVCRFNCITTSYVCTSVMAISSLSAHHRYLSTCSFSPPSIIATLQTVPYFPCPFGQFLVWVNSWRSKAYGMPYTWKKSRQLCTLVLSSRFKMNANGVGGTFFQDLMQTVFRPIKTLTLSLHLYLSIYLKVSFFFISLSSLHPSVS